VSDIVNRLRQREVALRSVTRQTATTKYDAELSGEAADLIESLREELQRERHRATNAEYRVLAYRNMLGEKGLAVAKHWDDKQIIRAHFDWGPGATALSGEERAQLILDLETSLGALLASQDTKESER
jgi:hypothetical protein